MITRSFFSHTPPQGVLAPLSKRVQKPSPSPHLPARVHVTVCHPDDCGVLLSPSFTFVPSVYTAILSLGDISLSKSRNRDPVRPHASWPARSPSDLAPPRSGLAVAPATPPSRVFMPARLCPEHRSPRWVRAGPSLRPSQHGSPVARSRAERRLARPHSSCPRPCSSFTLCLFFF